MKKPIVLTGLLLLSGAFVGAQTAIDDTRALLSQYVQTKKDIASAKSAWESEKQILEATIASLKTEQELLEAGIKAAEQARAESDDVRTRLSETRNELKDRLDRFAVAVSGYEKKILELLPFLPEPLTKSISRLTDRLPRDGRSTQDAPRRFVIVLGILQEIDKFQKSVQVHQQLLSIDGGEPREYSVLYYGLGKAFFVDETLGMAGFGAPSGAGWVWKADRSLAKSVDLAVQIADRKKLAQFVFLPVSVE